MNDHGRVRAVGVALAGRLQYRPAAAPVGLYQGCYVCAVITFEVIQTFELIFDVIYLVGLLLIVLPCLQTIG
ncbi:hypothetical protein AS156_00245 [Bradyrhizobium macuxiense]|uniref:Uncharacterized protein n=1 Tax=Bradyrhizobium macuxiense TaxID=1755647 RepID=A0A109JS79_9BRAD|nr:hypothetical protein AS156_00245 [Bradyrhizobium macuxiense]